MNRKLFIIVTIFFTLSLYGKEYAQVDETILSESSVDSGLPLDDYKLSNDKLQFSIAHYSQFANIMNLSIYELAFSFKPSPYYFITGSIMQGSGTFDTLSANHTPDSTLPAYDEAYYQRRKSDSLNFISFAVGPTFRFAFLGDFFNNSKLYETTSAYLTYTILADTLREKNYAGYGFRADYGVHYRLSRSFEIGTLISYHLASLQRPTEIEGESSASRTLSMRWFALGAKLAFFF